MAKKPIKITEVALRDAHQSLIATRMTMDEMRPILPAMDEVGYYSVECWGGATFDSCIRFLDEDPWDLSLIHILQELGNADFIRRSKRTDGVFRLCALILQKGTGVV